MLGIRASLIHLLAAKGQSSCYGRVHPMEMFGAFIVIVKVLAIPDFLGGVQKKKVIWGNLHHVDDFFKTGLEEVAIKVAASTDVELAKLSGEIITKVSSSLKIAYTADLRPTEPFPPNPLNKPIAETGFAAFLDWTFSITSEVKVLIILGGDLNRGLTIKLGEYQKNIEAKRFKAPNDP